MNGNGNIQTVRKQDDVQYNPIIGVIPLTIVVARKMESTRVQKEPIEVDFPRLTCGEETWGRGWVQLGDGSSRLGSLASPMPRSSPVTKQGLRSPEL